MNMNVSGVGFGAKMPVSRVRILKSKEPGAENYIAELMEQKGSEVYTLADRLKKNVVLNRVVGMFGKENVDALYVNSGANTSRIDLKAVKNGDEVIEGIKNNLILNA